jgi:hypothetical protein
LHSSDECVHWGTVLSKRQVHILWPQGFVVLVHLGRFPPTWRDVLIKIGVPQTLHDLPGRGSTHPYSKGHIKGCGLAAYGNAEPKTTLQT